MMASTRKRLSMLLGAVILAAVPAAFNASATENLMNVKASPDLRRVVIESSGSIEQYTSFEMERPPRLVIDIPGVRPGKASKTIPPERNGGLKIQVSESRSGTHVVLDFGGASVPPHRIKRMDKYLIVFLGDWIAPSGLRSSKAAGTPISRSKPKSRAHQSVKSVGNKASRTSSKLSDLSIKSARVKNGIIVLKVADRAHPHRLFRINLGVNLDRLGFVSAGIYPLRVNAPACGRQQEVKGPRRIRGPAALAQDSRSSNPAPGRRPETSKHPYASGPKRNPVQPGLSDRVSMLHNVFAREWKVNRILKQPGVRPRPELAEK